MINYLVRQNHSLIQQQHDQNIQHHHQNIEIFTHDLILKEMLAYMDVSMSLHITEVP